MRASIPFARNTQVFLLEIVATADSLREARDFAGDPVMHFGTRWRLLREIERRGGAPTFTDLGRLLDRRA